MRRERENISASSRHGADGQLSGGEEMKLGSSCIVMNRNTRPDMNVIKHDEITFVMLVAHVPFIDKREYDYIIIFLFFSLHSQTVHLRYYKGNPLDSNVKSSV